MSFNGRLSSHKLEDGSGCHVYWWLQIFRVVNKQSRYAWIFVIKSKKTPVGIISIFLDKFGHDKVVSLGLIKVENSQGVKNGELLS